jgi:hypothetical protein
MIVKELSENVHRVEIRAKYRRKDWEQWMLLLSDLHFDNPKCDRKLLFRHLDEAKRRNAPVFLNGDTLCLMQGKYDPRSNKSDILPQHNKKDYVDAVIEECAELLAPYGDLITVIGRGNHEQSILNRHETDVVRRLCLRLSEKAGRTIYPGGYGGYVNMQFIDGTSRSPVRIKYFHGSGGGGPVTKGTIKANRMATYLPDAHIVTTGHVHEKWAIAYTQERISDQGKITLSDQLHICTGTYKEEYGVGKGGWHVERGAPPKPTGGYWVRFTSDAIDSGNNRIKYSAMGAV